MIPGLDDRLQRQLWEATQETAVMVGWATLIAIAVGLPIGVLIQGHYFAEAKLLNVAHQFQQATDWHTKAPA